MQTSCWFEVTGSSTAPMASAELSMMMIISYGDRHLGSVISGQRAELHGWSGSVPSGSVLGPRALAMLVPVLVLGRVTHQLLEHNPGGRWRSRRSPVSRLQQRVDVMSSAVLIESRLQYIEN